MKPTDPLDTSGLPPRQRAMLDLVKPAHFSPRPQWRCEVCQDSTLVAMIGADGEVRYRSCSCTKERNAEAWRQRLTEEPDFVGLEEVRLEDLVPYEVQYAAYRATLDLIERPDHLVTLIGPAGLGKTHFAAAAAWALAGRMPVRFCKAPGLLGQLKALSVAGGFDFEERLMALQTVGCLVLDDLGTEGQTQWAQGTLHRLVDARYQARRPTLITTNIKVTDMSERLSARLLDMKRSALVTVTGALEVEQPEWEPGALPQRSSSYQRTSGQAYFICPRCQSRPCLDVCPEPLFRVGGPNS